MLALTDIHIGIVAWPDPSFLTSDAGCAMPFSIHRTLHPMLCIEKNETHGVWISLSARPKTLGGQVKMAIPQGWKIGSRSWIEKPSFVGDLTTSIIVPHQVMVQATEKAEFDTTLRHRLTPTGAEEILRCVVRAEGYHLGNNPLTPKPMIKPTGKVILKRNAVPAVAKRQRLRTDEYAEVLERHGRGETIEQLAMAFNFPAKRIKSYVDYRNKRTPKPEAVEACLIDLSKVSLKALQAAVAERERIETFDVARRQIADLARKLGVEVKALELGRATTKRGNKASAVGDRLSSRIGGE